MYGRIEVITEATPRGCRRTAVKGTGAVPREAGIVGVGLCGYVERRWITRVEAAFAMPGGCRRTAVKGKGAVPREMGLWVSGMRVTGKRREEADVGMRGWVRLA